MEQQAKETQNQIQFDNYNVSPVTLGPYTSHIWRTDPKHLGFLLARYKFVAKMLEGRSRVLEIGVGDAFGLPVVAQTVGSIHALDWEPLLLDDNRRRLNGISCTFECMDITENSPQGTFDAAYSLDVIEHIPEERDSLFMQNICNALTASGTFIIGTPNITAGAYASEASMEGHINLKSQKSLKALLQPYFENVFMFSMNDEMVHTGYGPMAHYLIGMGVGLKEGK